jgi:4-alpha-glucanotransferase
MSARDLAALAKALGVQPSYTDVMKRRRTATTETLLRAVSALLREEVASPENATGALERLERDRAARVIDPVAVAWDGRLSAVELHGRANQRVEVRVELESGEELGAKVPVRATGDDRRSIAFEEPLPPGEHRLVVDPGGRREPGEALVLSAPARSGAPDAERPRDWGVFLPLHALVTEHGWGMGDLTAFADLADWVRSLGGGVVASLPLLARFPDEPSPYSPASRLFWDERYVDVERELASGPASATKRLVRSARFAAAIEALRRSEVVDHAGVAARKREALERLAAERADDPELKRSARALPELEAYARFRAAGETLGVDWRAWPAAARDGRIRSKDVDADAVAYHRFAQVVADGQVADVGRRSAEGGAGLYLDMPIGTHADGFDVWRYRDDFATGMSVGAPPDAFFPQGQDWGFPPVHPLHARDHGYAYVRACLRHVFRHAGIVRIDHVMGLHRLFWVPQGSSAADGVYVRYPAEEWYASLALEAQRHGTVVVGEDLGTVPPEVRSGMRQHGVLRSYVVQYEVTPGDKHLPAPAADALATVNTHDMPTFASFWRGSDVDDRLEDGLLDDAGAERERSAREEVRTAVEATLRDAGLLGAGEPSEREVLEALLVWLGRSDAAYVVVTLEDLWSELRPVNVPGVMTRPNWRGKASRSLEQLRDDDAIAAILRRLDAARRGSDAEGANDEEAA